MWLYRTPAGIDLPATNAEISLWLDIESLRFHLSNYENVNNSPDQWEEAPP